MTFAEHVYAAYGPGPDYGVKSEAHASPMSEKHRFFGNNLPRIAQLLSQSSSGTLGVHFGVGGLANFEFVVTGQHQAAVLCDINKNQRLLWLSIFNLLTKNTDPHSFVQDFTKSVTSRGQNAWEEQFVHICQNTDIEIPLRCNPLQSGRIYGTESFSVFNDPAAYNYMRDMVLNGKIALAQLNLYDTPKLEELASIIQAYGLPISTVYLSNITSFEHSSSDITHLKRLLPKLIESGGEIIDNKTEYDDCYQNLVSGPGPLDNTSADFRDIF